MYQRFDRDDNKMEYKYAHKYQRNSARPILSRWINFNTLRPSRNGRRFANDTFKRIFLNENVRILIKISLKFVPKGPINNNPALVQIMAWRRSGDKPLSEPMIVSLLTHICVTRPQWVNSRRDKQFNPVFYNWCNYLCMPRLKLIM